MNDTPMSELDTSQLKCLTHLNISNTKIESFCPSGLKSLDWLWVDGAPIGDLDLRGVTTLKYIWGADEEGKRILTGPDVDRYE